MWRATFETTTDVEAPKLFDALADINNWKAWDDGLEYTAIATAPQAGADFVLKPKGGPKTRMTIERLSRPNLFSDIAHLPLAKMRTTHEFLTFNGRTSIRLTVEVWGILGFLWQRVIGQNQIKTAPQQTQSFIAYARNR